MQKYLFCICCFVPVLHSTSDDTIPNAVSIFISFFRIHSNISFGSSPSTTLRNVQAFCTPSAIPFSCKTSQKSAIVLSGSLTLWNMSKPINSSIMSSSRPQFILVAFYDENAVTSAQCSRMKHSKPNHQAL